MTISQSFCFVMHYIQKMTSSQYVKMIKMTISHYFVILTKKTTGQKVTFGHFSFVDKQAAWLYNLKS